MFDNLEFRPDLNVDQSKKLLELASTISSYYISRKFRESLKKDYERLRIIKDGIKQLNGDVNNPIIINLDGESKHFDKITIYIELRKQESLIDRKIKKLKSYFRKKSTYELYSKIKIGAVSKSILENISDKDNLDSPVDYDVFHRIKYLYNIPEVNTAFKFELSSRKDGFDLLDYGKKFHDQICKIDESISKNMSYILNIELKNSYLSRDLGVKDAELISIYREKILNLQNQLEDILQYKEPSTYERLFTLKKYKRQYETSGFILLPSRIEIINDIINEIMLGGSVLLPGPTGTGKTVLAIEAIKIVTNIHDGFVQLSGSEIGKEANQEGFSEKLEEAIYVVSGHPDITVGELISKVGLRGDGKGGTETYNQLGKILKAWTLGKIPIIDEIDLIPNDKLMRIKFLFALRARKLYHPQEGGKPEYLRITGAIATANIKSEKHPDRVDMDAANIRLFSGINVNYFSRSELYDTALTILMDRKGFIYNISKAELGKHGVLYALIEVVKDIEDNYLGKSQGERILNMDDQFLYKAVLELGNFTKFLKGFKSSGKTLHDFIKERLIKFVSNAAYPKIDRLIMLKIISSKGIITNNDIELLEKRIFDISKDDLLDSIAIHETPIIFSAGERKFLDPYEVSNLDPYEIRNFEKLKYHDSDRVYLKHIKELNTRLNIRQTEPIISEILEKLDNYIDKINNKNHFTESDLKTLFYILYKGDLPEEIINLSHLNDKTKELYDKLINFDYGPDGAKIFEKHERMKEEKSFVLSVVNYQNGIVDDLQAGKGLKNELGYVSTSLSKPELACIKKLGVEDVKVLETSERTITLNEHTESFKIRSLDIDGCLYTAIQLPQMIKNMKISDLTGYQRLQKSVENPNQTPDPDGEILVSANSRSLNQDQVDKLLSEKQNNPFYIVDADKTVGIDCIIWGKNSIKNESGEFLTLPVWIDGDCAVNYASKKGLSLIGVFDNLVIMEVIKLGLGDKYIDFVGMDMAILNGTNFKDESFLKEREELFKTIDNYLNIDFYQLINDGHILLDKGIITVNNRPIGVTRGRLPDNGCIGGVNTLALNSNTKVPKSNLSSRLSLIIHDGN